MTDPSWLQTIKANEGVHEYPGERHNPRIVAFHRATSLSAGLAEKDETAWCGSLMAWAMLENYFEPPSKAFRARNWIHWGIELPAPWHGCVTVIRHKAGPHQATRSGFHVAALDEITGDSLWLWGGNQSNAVRRSNFSLDAWEVCAYRWPVLRVEPRETIRYAHFRTSA